MICLTIVWQDQIEQYMGVNLTALTAKITAEMQTIQGEEPAPTARPGEHIVNRVERLNRLQSYLDLLAYYTASGRVDISPGHVARHPDPVITKIMKDRLLSYMPYTIINIEE